MDKKIFSSRLTQFANAVSSHKAEFAGMIEMSPQMLHKYINGERLPASANPEQDTQTRL